MSQKGGGCQMSRTIDIYESSDEYLLQLELLFDAANEGFFRMTPDGTTHFYNKKFYSVFDLNLDNNTLDDWMRIMHPDDQVTFLTKVNSQIANKDDMIMTQYRVFDKNGEIVWIEALGKYIPDGQSGEGTLLGYHADITARKLEEERIRHLAFNDDLTGLYNRNHVHGFLKEMLTAGGTGHLIYIDIHRFKNINMTFGYEYGDEFLKMVAERLKQLVPPHACLARNYVDEFIIVLPPHTGLNLDSLVQSIGMDLSSPFYLHETPMLMDYHICIYPLSPVDTEPEQVMHKAHVMVSHMKSNQITGVMTYNKDIEAIHLRQLAIERQLPWALTNKEMTLHYQPIVDTKNRRIKGFEALIRWTNPEIGSVRPDEFIPLAEKSTLINAIGDYVLNEACGFLKKLDSLGYDVGISVNLSIIQLHQPDYVGKTMETIMNHGVKPSQVMLEVTESVALDKSEYHEKLLTLHGHGLKLAIDDFGTGFSSLNAIISLPVSYLKIDRSLITKLMESTETITLVEMLSSYSHKVNYQIVAEGVETEILRDRLSSLDVDLCQGYLFSRPVDEQAAMVLLEQFKA